VLPLRVIAAAVLVLTALARPLHRCASSTRLLEAATVSLATGT
jgi:hypothetical protein